MLRGTMVVFAGLLTIVLLKRSLHLHHWMGIILIVAGAAMVGASRSEAFAHSYFSEGLFEVYVCAWRQTQCHSYSYENKLCLTVSSMIMEHCRSRVCGVCYTRM